MSEKKATFFLSPKIEAGLQVPSLIHQASNIRQSLEAAQSNHLTETLAQNLVAGIFAHVNQDQTVSPDYLPLIEQLASNHPVLRRILTKSLTRRGRCPSVLRPSIRKILKNIEVQLSPKKATSIEKHTNTGLQNKPLTEDTTLGFQDRNLDLQSINSNVSSGPAFNLNKVLGAPYNPLGSADPVTPEAIITYRNSLATLRKALDEYSADSSSDQFPDTLANLIAHSKGYKDKPEHERSKYYLQLAKYYSELNREELFKYSFSYYCFTVGRQLFASNKRKESRPYLQTFLHLYFRSPFEIQREMILPLYNSLSLYMGTFNIYVNIKDRAQFEIAEKFYANLHGAFNEMARQRQYQPLGRCLLDITVAYSWFMTDLLNRQRTRVGGNALLAIIQKALLDKNVFKAEPLACLTLLSKVDVKNVNSVLSRMSLSTADERRLVASALIRFTLDTNSSPQILLKDFAQQASLDTKIDLAFSILVEPLNQNLLVKGNELKSQLLAATIGFPEGTQIAEYFMARAAEMAELFHQFSRSSDPNLKGRYGYSILETIRLTRKWSAERLKGDVRNTVIQFYRTVEGYVTTEQSKLIRDTSLEMYLATDRAMYSPSNTRITLEIRNVGQGTADGLELELIPVEGSYNVEDRFRTYSIDILSDRTPIQKEVFIQPLVGENESIELLALLRYNTLKEKNKVTELNKVNRTVWLYPEAEFVRVPQPYNIGEPATTWFYGRHNLLEDMADNLHVDDVHDVSMIVYGLKRAGKTSVVKRFLQHTLDNKGFSPKYIPIYTDLLKDTRLQNATRDGEFLYHLISIINESLPGSTIEQRAKFNAFSFKDEFNINPYETFAFLLGELLEGISPKKLLIALDEFSILQSKLIGTNDSAVLSNKLFGFLSNTIQSTNQLTFIFTGTYMLLDMMREHTVDLAKICTPYMVGFLDDNSARDLVVEPVEKNLKRLDKGWIEYDPRVVEQIVRLTNKHPFLIQYLCMQLVNRVNQSKHNSVTLNDITSVIDEIVNRPMHAPTMHILWNEFNIQQHRVLSTIADKSSRTQEWVDIDEIIETYGEFGDSSTVEDVLAICLTLSDADLLEKSSMSEVDSYRITVPLYQLWLRQNKTPRAVFSS